MVQGWQGSRQSCPLHEGWMSVGWGCGLSVVCMLDISIMQQLYLEEVSERYSWPGCLCSVCIKLEAVCSYPSRQ